MNKRIENGFYLGAMFGVLITVGWGLVDAFSGNTILGEYDLIIIFLVMFKVFFIIGILFYSESSPITNGGKD